MTSAADKARHTTAANKIRYRRILTGGASLACLGEAPLGRGEKITVCVCVGGGRANRVAAVKRNFVQQLILSHHNNDCNSEISMRSGSGQTTRHTTLPSALPHHSFDFRAAAQDAREALHRPAWCLEEASAAQHACYPPRQHPWPCGLPPGTGPQPQHGS